MMNRKRFAYCVLGAILALVFAFSGSSAQAGSISFQTVNGQQGDGPVSAQADFTTLSGQVKIVLTDLYQNPKAAGQLISGITFTVSGATGNASISSAKGMTSNIADGGAYSPTGPNNLTHWGVSGKTTVTLETAGSAAQGGTPIQMIIGPDNKGGVSGAGLYSNANSSITGNHNPNTIGSATFYLNIAGVTVDSTISSVKFLFGTGPDGSESGPNVGVVPPSVTVPEPATLSLAGMALLGAAGFCSRRRKHA